MGYADQVAAAERASAAIKKLPKLEKENAILRKAFNHLRCDYNTTYINGIITEKKHSNNCTRCSISKELRDLENV